MSDGYELLDVETLTVDDGDLVAKLTHHEITSKDGFHEGKRVAVFDTGRGIELVPASEVDP